MTKQIFDYEKGFMGVRDSKPKSYVRAFRDDYRLKSLTGNVTLKKGRLLDIGCGGGMISESLPYYYPKVAIHGCDVSRTAIAYAKSLATGSVRYRTMVKKLPYRDSFFDVCICLDVLEHVPDVSYFLKEVRRVLKKNGQFFLIVPCEGQLFTYTWFLKKIGLGSNLTFRYFGHIHPEFTHKSVLELLVRYDFRLDNVSYSEHSPYQLMHFIIYFLPKILLEIFLGKKKTKEYTNSGLISAPKKRNSFLMIIRKVWFIFFNFVNTRFMYWEATHFTNIAATAWKLHATTRASS